MAVQTCTYMLSEFPHGTVDKAVFTAEVCLALPEDPPLCVTVGEVSIALTFSRELTPAEKDALDAVVALHGAP